MKGELEFTDDEQPDMEEEGQNQNENAQKENANEEVD